MQVWYGSRRCQVLNRLMRGAVLADKDGIMGKYIYGMQPTQCGDAYSRSHVIHKNKKCWWEGDDSPVIGHAVLDRGHGVFPYSVMYVPAHGPSAWWAVSFNKGFVAGAEVCWAAYDCRYLTEQDLEYFTAGAPGSCVFLSIKGDGAAQVVYIRFYEKAVPYCFQVAGHVFIKIVIPGIVQSHQFFLPFIERGISELVNFKARIAVTADILLCGLYFFFPQGRAVGIFTSFKSRAPLGNACPGDDYWRFGFLFLSLLNGTFNLVIVMAVNLLHMPVAWPETHGDIVGHGQVSAAFNGNVIGIVYIDDVAKLKMPGQRGSFRRDSFHDVAVADYAVYKMINDLESVRVEFIGKVTWRHSHAYAVGKALAQRTGGGLDTGRNGVLGMARCFAAQLTEIHYVFNGKRIPGQMEEGIEQHWSMACWKNKTVPVYPRRVVGIMDQKFAP